MEQPFYQEYVTDDTFIDKYNQYQQRYANQMRESDKVLLQLIGEAAGASGSSPVSLLDIGCSTGNLLRYIKAAYPDLQLTGGDMTDSSLALCRCSPELAGIRFENMNMLALPANQAFDIIVAHAVLYMFSNEEFAQALASVAGALKPGGWFITYDFFHEFRQFLTIHETSQSHPQGLMLHFRPMAFARRVLEEQGFQLSRFLPFQIPIDLPRNQSFGDNKDGFEDLNSYTVKTEAGEQLLFRGALYQPWCHLIAQKG